MARIDALPSIEIIRGFKGILDFYVWRGLPCVRAWPKYRPAKQTAPSLAAALVFGAIIKAFSLTHSTVLDQLEIEATGIPRTTRDLYVSAVYGKLHEASMSDFLDLLTQCRDLLLTLQDLRHPLHDVGLDEYDVRVHTSALPLGASTAADQGTQNDNLILIAQLQDALESKALDRLLVRGMDQLFTYKDSLFHQKIAAISGANGYLETDPAPAGQVWIVTNIKALDATNATTVHEHRARRAGATYEFNRVTAAFAANQPSFTHSWIWLYPGDRIRVAYAGGQAGDTCLITLVGHVMTLET